MATLSYVGYILALIGGIIIILVSLFDILGSPFLLAFSVLGAAGAFANGLVGLIIGVICVVGAKYVNHLGWAIVLLILGIIATGIGGLLVVLGAIIGLIARFTHE